jgi:Rhomboid family
MGQCPVADHLYIVGDRKQRIAERTSVPCGPWRPRHLVVCAVGRRQHDLGQFGAKESHDSTTAAHGHGIGNANDTTTSVLIVMAFSFIPFVDWAAHLGGLLAGIVVGMVIFGKWRGSLLG